MPRYSRFCTLVIVTCDAAPWPGHAVVSSLLARQPYVPVAAAQ